MVDNFYGIRVTTKRDLPVPPKD